MRPLILIALFVCLAAGQSILEKTDEAFKKWAGCKAIESCLGEQARKTFLLKMKKSHAKCSNQVVPLEVQLEATQSSAKLVRALLDGAEFKEKDTMAKLRDALGLPEAGVKNYAFPYALPFAFPQAKKDEEEDTMLAMMKKLFMKKMFKKLMEKHADVLDEGDDKDEKLSRKRREEPEDATETNVEAVPLPATTHSAGDLFDLGDRLTQKLNEQKKEFALKLSNYSCILQDLNIVDNENEIQLEQMLDGLKDLGISDPWLLNALTESKKICYERSQALPESVLNSCVIGPKWMKIKEFMTCCKESKMRTCMNYDIKQKLEADFGPIEKLTESTGLTEKELLGAASSLVFGSLDFD